MICSGRRARTISGGPTTVTSTVRGMSVALESPITSTGRFWNLASTTRRATVTVTLAAGRADVTHPGGRRVDGDPALVNAFAQPGHVERREPRELHHLHEARGTAYRHLLRIDVGLPFTT